MSELEIAIKELKEHTDDKELPYIIADIIKKNCDQEVIDLILQHLMVKDNTDLSEALAKFKDNTEMFEEIALKDSHSYKDDTVIEAYVYHFNNIVIERALLKAQELEKENARYKELEELVGCSLDFIFKVLKAPKIYTEGMNVRSEYDNRFKYCPRINQYILNPYAIEGKRPEFLFIDRWGHGYDLRLKDHKKTWWFKEDKSE